MSVGSARREAALCLMNTIVEKFISDMQWIKNRMRNILRCIFMTDAKFIFLYQAG